ncbi:MAG TPA: hypothetical protein VJ835_03665, partial [Fimbriimonadaceae bacterium]|nr:hypothetical protein [Fimbriimonadaceae bacterium]
MTKTRPRDRGTGSFKERTRVLRDGTERRYFEGYVYAADGKQCYGSGTTQQEAEARAMLNKYRHEQRLPAVIALTGILNNYPRTIGAPEHFDQVPPLAPTELALTMADYVRKFIKGRTLKRKSRIKYEGFLKNIEDTEFFAEYAASWPSLGAMPITKIEKEHIDSFVDAFQERWSERSAYNLQCFVKTVLTHAWDNHKKTGMTENPTTDLKVRHKRRRRRVPLSWEIMQLLIQECKHPCLRAFLILASYGLRVGEIVALTEDDIDDNGRVTIRYTQ